MHEGPTKGKSNPNYSEEYTPLYRGIGKGDTWTLPKNLEENPRESLVVEVRKKFAGPVNVLDIGCGKGLNTKWIAEIDSNSHWTGSDVVSANELGLEIPKDDDRFYFYEGNILDKDFRNKYFSQGNKFEIIVDQGSILAELEDEDVRAEYLNFVANHLTHDGRYVVLVMEGNGGIVVFPDGRHRHTYSAEDFTVSPFKELFDVEESNLFSYSYLPESADWPEVKNPLGAKVGDERQLTAAQFVLKKKEA